VQGLGERQLAQGDGDWNAGLVDDGLEEAEALEEGDDGEDVVEGSEEEEEEVGDAEVAEEGEQGEIEGQGHAAQPPPPQQEGGRPVWQGGDWRGEGRWRGWSPVLARCGAVHVLTQLSEERIGAASVSAAGALAALLAGIKGIRGV